MRRQREDEEGIRGILLQRNVVPTAALALKTNIASLAPLVLPFSELVRGCPLIRCQLTPSAIVLLHAQKHCSSRERPVMFS